MSFNREAKKAFKCELCGGNPACAAICPTGAIVAAERDEFYAVSEELPMRGYAILLRRNRENAAKKLKK